MPEASKGSSRPPIETRTGDLIRPPEKDGKGRSKEKRKVPSPPKPAGWGARLLLIVLTIAAFFPLFESDVLRSEYDLAVRSAYPAMETWKTAWTPQTIRTNDPFSLTSYFMETALPLPAAQAHRAINLLLHLTAVFLLLKCLETLKLPGAFMTALIFALHPAVIQALFWPGYRDVLIALIFILAALFFSLRKQNTADYFLGLAFSIAAILAHSAALGLPLILGLLILFQQKKFNLAAFNRVLPLLCISLFLGVWIKAGMPASAQELGSQERFNQAGQNLYFFIRQSLLPLENALFYPLDPNTGRAAAGPSNLLPLLLFFPFFILIGFNIDRAWARGIFLTLSSFLVLLLPSLLEIGSFIDGSPALEEHGLYLALPFLLAFIFVGMAASCRRIGEAATFLWRVAFTGLLILALALSVRFSYTIGEPARMWEQIMRQWPASNQAKVAFFEALEGQESITRTSEEKINLLTGILVQEPSRHELRINLARIYRNQGQMSNALREYSRILREYQPDAEVLEEAAVLFDKAGMRWEATSARRRIQTDPSKTPPIIPNIDSP